MASIFDQALSVGLESTYGTAVAPTRSYEGQSDDWQREMEYITSQGFRDGMQTTRGDRYENVSLGATGSVSVDVLNKGMGLILQHSLGASVAPAQVGGTAAYTASFTTNDIGPAGSYTWQMLRTSTNGTVNCFTYEGCKATNLDFEMALGSNLNMTIGFDAENEQIATSAATPVYVAATSPFPYTQAAIELDNSAVVNITGASVSLDLAMKTDRRFLKGAATKGEPLRNGVPAYTGSLTAEFSSMADYNRFVAGSNHKLELIMTGTTAIAASNFPFFHITMPQIRFEGATPVASLDDLGSVEMPFTILDGGVGAAVTIATQSTDTAF